VAFGAALGFAAERFTSAGLGKEQRDMGLREEGLRAFGAWEPLAHHIRCGGAEHGAKALYDWQHTEDFILGLKERGFNLYITHFSKGYGIEAEAEERENTRRVAELCHKHGIYVGGYTRLTTFIPETMEAEIPDCIERFGARTPRGEFARYGRQYWRYIPCPTSQDYLDYFGQLIRIGVGEVGLDCLHVDGMYVWHEPYACRCPRCAADFRDWLAERFPRSSAQKERFGLPGLEHVEPPDFDVFHEPAFPLPIARDPLAQEWILYRCRVLGRLWRFIVETAHGCNPECVVQGNSHFYPGANNAWHGGLEIAELARVGGDGFFTEEGAAPNLTPDGRLHGYFESFKKLRRLGYQVFTYNREPETLAHAPMTEPERLKRGMAHQMSFNLDSAGVFCAQIPPGEWPVTVPEYMAFHRDRRDLFRRTRQAHDVAIYYSERTRSLNCGTPIVTSLLTNDVLMRGHVPFGFLLAARREELSQFRAVVLPEVECLSDAEAAALGEYVKAGGGLLILGANTGLYTELRALRTANALAAALGLDWGESSSAFATCVGSGRVAYLPGLLTPDGAPADLVEKSMAKTKPHFYLLNTDWRPPLNAAELLDYLEWAAGGFSFELALPDSVVAEFAEQPGEGRRLIHLVNFDLERDVGPFEVLCRGASAARAEAFTPDGAAPEVGAAPAPPDAVRLSVPGFRRYLILAISEDGEGGD